MVCVTAVWDMVGYVSGTKWAKAVWDMVGHVSVTKWATAVWNTAAFISPAGDTTAKVITLCAVYGTLL